MIETPKPLPLQFWRSNQGREPTRHWFKELPRGDRATIGLGLKRLQYGWPIGMPLVRSLGGGLWEVRSTLPSRREARTLFLWICTALLCCMGSSRKPKKHRQLILNWRERE